MAMGIGSSLDFARRQSGLVVAKVFHCAGGEHPLPAGCLLWSAGPMEILVFGGTVFLSRAVAELGVARGHNVTTFNRGQAGPPVDGARAITGDRTNPDD
ncbi:MAG: hypothetical protein JO144_15120, partial [Actinobacteria bacterium]|nr:hypothetical protein [Actinomycetota bacterium]